MWVKVNSHTVTVSECKMYVEFSHSNGHRFNVTQARQSWESFPMQLHEHNKSIFLSQSLFISANNSGPKRGIVANQCVLNC